MIIIEKYLETQLSANKYINGIWTELFSSVISKPKVQSPSNDTDIRTESASGFLNLAYSSAWYISSIFFARE